MPTGACVSIGGADEGSEADVGGGIASRGARSTGAGWRGELCSGEEALGSWPKLVPADNASVMMAAADASRAVNFERSDPLRDISLRELTIWQNLLDRMLLRSHAPAVERKRAGSYDTD